MQVFLIRHGLSEANNRANLGTPAFGSPDAELMSEGVEQARQIPSILLARFAIQAANEQVATSTMLRSQQTAKEAGYTEQRHYELLDEIATADLGFSRPEVRAMIDSCDLAEPIINEAEKTLSSPPVERFWFTHGLRIAGICKLLDQHQDERFVPKFCEIRRIDI